VNYLEDIVDVLLCHGTEPVSTDTRLEMATKELCN